MLGFLHTAESHVETFTEVVRSLGATVPMTHLVREDLLAAARARGSEDPALLRDLAEAVRSLVAGGARVVMCTCSTLGAAAEQMDGLLGARVLRVDRPMAEMAVKCGERIAVVAALQSTLGPTRALLHDAAERTGRPIEVKEVLCEEAWADFERGDLERYLERVAGAIGEASEMADVVVLAQASMAPAANRPGVRAPVLASPGLGVVGALRVLRSLEEKPAEDARRATTARRLVESYYERLWNGFDRSLIPELLTEDVSFRGSLGQEATGHVAFAEYMRFVHDAFPDFRNHVEEIVDEDDRAFARLTYTGTHRGELFGIAPTGRSIRYAGAALFHLRGERICSIWVLGDLWTLVRQLREAAVDPV